MPDTMPIIVTEVTEIRIAKDQPVSVSIINLEDKGKTTPPPHGKIMIGLKFSDNTTAIRAVIDASNFAYQLQNDCNISYIDSFSALFMSKNLINSPERQKLSAEDENVLADFEKSIDIYNVEEQQKSFKEPRPRRNNDNPDSSLYYLTDKIKYSNERCGEEQ